ncbi:hypothetical protein [Dactylosporangium sp. CS-033363]|uniref:hypothetical protein n=1 Tax=Dactylosporangium sp. CS-033363 TaxID=3239935 RepID=UPI003D8D048C
MGERMPEESTDFQRLSDLHRKIGAQIVVGATDATIAAMFYLSEATVRRRLAELKRFTRTSSRASLAAEIVRRGLINPANPAVPADPAEPVSPDAGRGRPERGSPSIPKERP